MSSSDDEPPRRFVNDAETRQSNFTSNNRKVKKESLVTDEIVKSERLVRKRKQAGKKS